MLIQTVYILPYKFNFCTTTVNFFYLFNFLPFTVHTSTIHNITESINLFELEQWLNRLAIGLTILQ